MFTWCEPNKMAVVVVLNRGIGWLPIMASIGIGAVAYRMMKPNNKMGQAVKGRINKMVEQKELFPNS
ncbi:hypothetical protein GMB86_05650 [Terrilactibacillus sp. BCM23-1]|uniref:Uncharacterized protein n=1 Tax=Terrilactibacillus tamarindi TaxID=2599694 RepID=A0A6N8CQN8_9BACI|nr:hypothetical protein [Terrilactibacillus tamarindi]MTT31497.1 hypothetical protein [Terrilactibacillus tamarindi]